MGQLTPLWTATCTPEPLKSDPSHSRKEASLIQGLNPWLPGRWPACKDSALLVSPSPHPSGSGFLCYGSPSTAPKMFSERYHLHCDANTLHGLQNPVAIAHFDHSACILERLANRRLSASI